MIQWEAHEHMSNRLPQRKFFTKLDLFVLLIALSVITGVVLTIKLVFQKDTYITVDLIASGGEWWWGTPPPYYWNTDPLKKGAIEYDVLRKPLVEILEVTKFDNDVRKVVWMKARIKVLKNIRANSYTFKQQSVAIGKTIIIAPNNISIVANVVGIEGIEQENRKETRIITVKKYKMRQWEADLLEVGDVMKDDKGEILAEVLEKKVEPTEFVTTTWLGEPLLKRDPLWKDVTLKLRILVTVQDNSDYFNFYQFIQAGEAIHIQLSKYILDIQILRVESE